MIPDDNITGIVPGIQQPPAICVDYLSHEWKEHDIWTSWKAMSKQKKEIANGIRLENASWRTWAQQKYHLRTVNPSTLNWLKDSDVTWLYGPLHTAQSPLLVETSPKSPPTEDKLDLMGTICHKSCLKKKSISEILRSTRTPRTSRLNSSLSDTQLYQKDSNSTRVPSSHSLSTLGVDKQEYHIRFNNRVEQCIAIDSEEEDEEDEDIEGNSSESGCSSDDSAIVMKISRARGKDKDKKEYSSICKLEPTTLKSDKISSQYSALYSRRRRSSGRSSSSSSSTTTPSPSPVETPSTAVQSSFSDTSSQSRSTIPPTSPTASLPYPTYSNSCASWSDELNVDDYDYTALGVLTHGFEFFDEKGRRGDENEFDRVGFVDRAVHIASNVKDIVHWCSSMVFNGQVF